MATKIPLDGYDGLWESMSRFSDILRKSNIENWSRLTDSIAKAIEPSLTVAEIVGRQTKLISNFNIPEYTQKLAVTAVEKQWKALSYIADAYRTPEIVSLQNSLIHNDFSGLQAFADSLKTSHIEAANLAIIKMAPVFETVSFPRGIMSAVNGLHVEAAKRLLYSESVGFDVEERLFYVEASPSDRATISETNILCSSLKLLSDIDEADLISFLTQLEKFPAFASEHETGQRIREIVANWNQYLDFDHEYFYHARSLKDGACPYTESELRQAPTGYAGHGRFNYVGQSHYYFSDVE